MTTTSTTSTYVPPPPPSFNGGLYTGEPFQTGAPWRNYPVTPDAGYYNFTNLPDAPVIAQHHVPGGGLRPGNNTPLLPSDFASSRVDGLNAICIPESRLITQEHDPEAERGFNGGFAYIN